MLSELMADWSSQNELSAGQRAEVRRMRGPNGEAKLCGESELDEMADFEVLQTATKRRRGTGVVELDSTVGDLDDALTTNTCHASISDRASLVSGGIPSAQTQAFLRSSFQGEDRRALQNTPDKTVRVTLSRGTTQAAVSYPEQN
ncbi:hypothetical protein C1H76_3047 [Elsinoe australis]|uniref:Uncharacterized protein n=1 Tax=Elsinoe australis TaxID=40998 RepID=A0A4U7B5C3_9PEZI|nr:hypothetical protein C1H76_3047 [Elsinoe australis]